MPCTLEKPQCPSLGAKHNFNGPRKADFLMGRFFQRSHRNLLGVSTVG
jgi:hypothetical protein